MWAVNMEGSLGLWTLEVLLSMEATSVSQPGCMIQNGMCPVCPVGVLTSANVVPVRVKGTHLLVGSRLYDVAPRGKLHTARVLQVLRVRLDEVSRGDIAHGDTTGLVVRHVCLWDRDGRAARSCLVVPCGGGVPTS